MTFMSPLFLSGGGARLKLKMLHTPLEAHPSLKTSKSEPNIFKLKMTSIPVFPKKIMLGGDKVEHLCGREKKSV